MEATGPLASALLRARTMLGQRPDLAAQQASAILEAAPGHPEAQFILGGARRRLGDIDGARAVLEPLAAAQPAAAAVHFEWACVQADLGMIEGAIDGLRRVLRLKPDMPGAWRRLGDLQFASGDKAAAAAAYAKHLQAADRDPLLTQAARALVDGDLDQARTRLESRIAACPTDVAALRMLAEVATREGRDADAEALLRRCLERAPGFVLAQHNLAVVLFRQNRPREALEVLAPLLLADPQNPNYRALKAASLAMVADYDGAIALYGPLLEAFPQQPKVWMSYGHALKTAGRREEAIEAYRRAIAQQPGLGEAYWSLANMKNFRWAPEEIAAAESQLERTDLAPEDRFHLHYALGSALEQAGRFEASWARYAEGARLRRVEIGYDAAQTTARRRRLEALLTPDFFAQRQGVGCLDEAPIFVVGLPRSGSTLIEQILASHSAIEGTMELPELSVIVRDIARSGGGEDAYPEHLADLPHQAFRDLGARYLEETRGYRKTDRPVFIDKMPNNFVHVGLIHLILPRARIIDARRHPMATCFSAFKQHFARGQHFSYDLEELGRYYGDYAALMDHFDAVLPGRVLRVRYEDMVDDQEAQTRRLLEYCEAPFEAACLRFHENTRAVRTASSEQVRRPIYREGLDQWRNYEPWLGPLAEALGVRMQA